MPIRYHENYPHDWPAIALAVKEGNGYICQMCGQQCTRPGEQYDRRRAYGGAPVPRLRWPGDLRRLHLHPVPFRA